VSFSRAQQNKARGYAGISKLRKTLQRLEPEAVAGVKEAFQQGAETIHYDVLQNGMAHKLTGDMLSSVAVKYGRDGLTAVIGPGADVVTVNKSPFNTTLYVSQKRKWHAWQFFKAYWIEFGTKGAPDRNIPPQPAQPFVGPAFDANKGAISKNVQSKIHAVIAKLASGPDE